MQDRTLLNSRKPSSSSPLLNTGVQDASEASSEAPPLSFSATHAVEEPSMLDQSLTSLRETLGEHKGKLAISAAAMLGLLVYYKWGEKSLAKEDPEEYERLRRIKERVRHADHEERPGDKLGSLSSEKPRS